MPHSPRRAMTLKSIHPIRTDQHNIQTFSSQHRSGPGVARTYPRRDHGGMMELPRLARPEGCRDRVRAWPARDMHGPDRVARLNTTPSATPHDLPRAASPASIGWNRLTQWPNRVHWRMRAAEAPGSLHARPGTRGTAGLRSHGPTRGTGGPRRRAERSLSLRPALRRADGGAWPWSGHTGVDLASQRPVLSHLPRAAAEAGRPGWLC